MTLNAPKCSLHGLRIRLVTRQPFESANEGGSIRVSAVRQVLAEAGAVVDVVTTGDEGVSFADWLRWPRTWEGLRAWASAFARTVVRSPRDAVWLAPPRAFYRLEKSLLTRPADLTVIEYSYNILYGRAVGAPVIVDLHNIESDLEARYVKSAMRQRTLSVACRVPLLMMKARWLARVERGLGASVDGVVVVSEPDRKRFQEISATPAEAVPIRVAPNGTSSRAFEVKAQRDAHRVVFVGLLGWGPNIDAAVWLAKNVWPLVLRQVPDARLDIVGKAPTREVRELASSSITVHADVPDVLEYVGKARVATAPLLAAGGTRLKIVEALACGVPVVATPLGALGLESLEGPALVIRESASDFAAALVQELRSPAPARREIRDLVQAYRWDQALKPMVELAAEISQARVSER